MIIQYKLEKGQVVRRIVHRSRLRGEARPDRHFSATLLKAYYAKECEDGSRFKSSYPKSVIKNVHQTALARFDETGAAT